MLTPADLFVEYWGVAKNWSGNVVNGVMLPPEEFSAEVDAALLIPDGQESYDLLTNLVGLEGNGNPKGKKLVVLRNIDTFFSRIHPRIQYHAGLFRDISVSHWVRRLKIQRQRAGIYLRVADTYLIPKGPLTRNVRSKFATSAYEFSDQFEYLTVAPSALDANGRAIEVDMVSKSRAAHIGVPISPAANGEESVAFIPVAQLDPHLELSERSHNSCSFFDFSLNKTLDAADIITDQISDFGYADIVIAPELVISEDCADELQVRLRANPGQMRIMVAGSGSTRQTEDGMSWNESRILNGSGEELWRQRKFWQAGLDQRRAKSYGLAASTDTLVMEDNQSGSNVIIADIDGLGRCVVLICQDIMATSLAVELVRHFQPDWVFTPILDAGVDPGRWAHQRAFELSALSPARFLIVSSLSLAHKLGKQDVPCGLAIGPKDAIAVDGGRACAKAEIGRNPHGYSIIKWRSGTWFKSQLGTVDD